MVMYLNAYVHFSQFSRFCADFRINFAQIFASVKTYVKNRGSHESSYRSSKQLKFSAEISAERTNERTDERTNEFFRRNSAEFSAEMLIRIGRRGYQVRNDFSTTRNGNEEMNENDHL